MKVDKQLRDPINFKKIISYFLLAFFIYSSVAVSMLLMFDDIYNYEDFVIIAFPLPLFIILSIYLLYKDEMIKLENSQVLEEIKVIRESNTIRKKAEGCL